MQIGSAHSSRHFLAQTSLYKQSRIFFLILFKLPEEQSRRGCGIPPPFCKDSVMISTGSSAGRPVMCPSCMRHAPQSATTHSAPVCLQHGSLSHQLHGTSLDLFFEPVTARHPATLVVNDGILQPRNLGKNPDRGIPDSDCPQMARNVISQLPLNPAKLQRNLPAFQQVQKIFVHVVAVFGYLFPAGDIQNPGVFS